ncbi:MAG: BrnA antitoxin family protein [Acaryochloridaceae cyanobacterium RU_4_10]|nr:BrnA antitoxin family protein [Acaryochloridaceae cyanobacterium RU_4_10]
MKKEATSNNSLTDWNRLNALQDADIDLTDCPEVTPEQFAKAVVRRGGLTSKTNKEQITLRLDKDVLDWFKAQGQRLY